MNSSPFKPSAGKVKSPSREGVRSLVEAAGGPEFIRKIMDDFYRRMSHDVLIGFFFDGKDLDSIARQQTNFILNAAGLLDRYEGKGPSTAHIALPPILKGHFDRRLVILHETLQAHHLPETIIQAWMEFEESFRLLVVSKE